MTMLPLEEAPFQTYLQILRDNGHAEDADISEQFYIDLLTTIKSTSGEYYTREHLMTVKFKDILAASEQLLNHAKTEAEQIPVTDIPISGKAMMGRGADSLSPQTIRQLAERQSLYHEENKAKVVR